MPFTTLVPGGSLRVLRTTPNVPMGYAAIAYSSTSAKCDARDSTPRLYMYDRTPRGVHATTDSELISDSCELHIGQRQCREEKLHSRHSRLPHSLTETLPVRCQAQQQQHPYSFEIIITRFRSKPITPKTPTFRQAVTRSTNLDSARSRRPHFTDASRDSSGRGRTTCSTLQRICN